MTSDQEAGERKVSFDEVAQQLSEEEEEEDEEEGEVADDALKPKSLDDTGSSDQASPRGVLEAPVQNADSDNSSSRSESCRGESELADKRSASNGSVLEPQGLAWRSLITGFLLRRKKSMRRLATFPFSEEKSELKGDLVKIHCSEDHMDFEGAAQPAKRGRPSWRNFDYQELVLATNNFSPDMLIGKGGHAEVYKGCLNDGQLVAVKKLTKGKSEEERTGDFLTELGIIAHVDHPNAAQLLGFSVDEGLHLVLQFSPHGSLATILHGSKEKFEWGVRFNIALGVAQGLRYLHEGCHRRIIHRDIKASNILLTEDYQPQISDFGLAKWLPEKLPHHVVFPIEGTFGYMAPEYFMHGLVNEKTDVFAFGVLLLELITGRRAVDSSQQNRQSLVMWVKPLLAGDKMQELIDPAIGNAYDSAEMNRAVSVASMCIHHVPTARPDMNMVVRLLTGEDEPLDLLAKAQKSAARRLPIFDASDLEDYTCSRYLNDLNRHKQLALEQ